MPNINCAASVAEFNHDVGQAAATAAQERFRNSSAFADAMRRQKKQLLDDRATFWEAFGPDAVDDAITDEFIRRVVRNAFAERDYDTIGKIFWQMADHYLEPLADEYVSQQRRECDL